MRQKNYLAHLEWVELRKFICLTRWEAKSSRSIKNVGMNIDMTSSPQHVCEAERDLYAVTQSLSDWSMKSGLVLAIRRYNSC